MFLPFLNKKALDLYPGLFIYQNFGLRIRRQFGHGGVFAGEFARQGAQESDDVIYLIGGQFFAELVADHQLHHRFQGRDTAVCRLGTVTAVLRRPSILPCFRDFPCELQNLPIHGFLE